MSNVASNLVGHKIGDWKVIQKIAKGPTSTGGSFSSAYVVENSTGKRAFMKAINIGYAMNMFMPRGGRRSDVLKEITEQFSHEVNLLDACEEKRLDKIVIAIEDGEYRDPADPYFIPYLVFELCPEGDVRRHPKLQVPGYAWPLRVFHEVCVGLKQLHSVNIIHQDLKPSNVLIESGTKAKIADLGRATKSGSGAMFSTENHWGDPAYTPVEFMYNHFEPDPVVRQKAADFYMLGGILAFLIAKVNFYSMMLTKLPTACHPRNWHGRYQDVLPALHQAANEAIAEVIQDLPAPITEDVRSLLKCLLHPEPQMRGHAKTVMEATGNKFSLERIITVADVIAAKARIHAK